MTRTVRRTQLEWPAKIYLESRHHREESSRREVNGGGLLDNSKEQVSCYCPRKRDAVVIVRAVVKVLVTALNE